MPTTDWNLIIQGNISLLWCQWCMDPMNRTKTLSTLLEEFYTQYQNVEPLNIGTLLMAAYILFVYPQQTEFENINFDAVPTGDFNVVTGTLTTEKKRFCARIRNSLAHGRFAVHSDLITLTDQKPDGKDKFEANISVTKFGIFINEFMHEVKNKHYIYREKGTDLFSGSEIRIAGRNCSGTTC